MTKLRMIFSAALIGALPLLSGCVPAVLVTGAAVGVMSAHDRRSTGVQADDEVAEWKGSNRMPARFADSPYLLWKRSCMSGNSRLQTGQKVAK